jgi:aspartyl-tRNA(Asn)/glutamyl-tRNA(Gln) amidotransferase subunit A
MIPLGKTVTTQFASIDPPVTRNPWNLDRTPGGSSSGSCAAVACRMIPLALGSQTGGSINRPSSFCGVAGLKLTFGEWKTDGVVRCASGLDTLGPIVPSVRDLKLIYDTLPSAFDSENHRNAFHSCYQNGLTNGTKVLFLGGKFEDLSDQDMWETVNLASQILNESGCQVEFQNGSHFFDDELWQIHRSLMMIECYLTHQQRFDVESEFYLPQISRWVEEGRQLEAKLSDDEFHSIYTRRGQRIRNFQALFDSYDVILTPAARGQAPTPETTGDPIFNAPWTLLGVPSVTVPVRLSSNGLPLGVQMVATSFGGPGLGRLLATAELLERKCYEGSDTR